MYTALKQAGLNDRVKMVTPLEMSILGASYPPSAGQVADAHLEVVSQVVKFLVRIGEGSLQPTTMSALPWTFRYSSATRW